MAITTKTRRLSIINFGSMWPDTMPEPNSTIDVDDRLHFLDLYSGTAGVSGGPPSGGVMPVRYQVLGRPSIEGGATLAGKGAIVPG